MKTSNLEIYTREVKESKKYPYIRYQAYFYVYQNNTRKRIRSDYFTARSKAKKHAKELQLEYFKNGSVVTKDATIDDIFKIWIDGSSINDSTRKSYTSIYNLYIKGLYKNKKRKDFIPINNLRASDLTTIILQQHINQVSSLINVKGTFNCFRTVIINILRTAYRKDLVAINFCDKLEFSMKDKKSNSRKTMPADFENCKQYIEYLLSSKGPSILKSYNIDTHILLLELLRVTGARVSEILSLSWDHFDITNRKFYITETKNGVDREIPLSTETVSILIDWKRKQDKVLFISGLTNVNNTILTSRRGVNLSYQSVMACMRTFWKKTGIHITTHQFRHSKATLSLNVMKESLSNVSTALGHLNQSSTLHYLHDDNTMVREMNEKYEQLTPRLLN
ncbi:MAG: tyrosine-type recombinase/integrase [Coprobacillaceae bacterium]